MENIPLESLPKQSLTVSLAGILYQLDIIFTAGVTSMNVIRGGVTVAQGARCVAGQVVLNYLSQEAGNGNFLFFTQDDDLPNYTAFGITTFLFYVDNATLEAIRAVPDITLVLAQASATMTGVAVMRGVT